MKQSREPVVAKELTVLCKEEGNLSPSASDVVVRSQGSKEEPEAATANSTKPIAMDLPVEDPMATGVDASVTARLVR